MPEKDPLSYTFFTYAWVIGMSSWGGIAGYIRKIKNGHCRFSITELIGEICIAGLVGIVTFFLCESAEFNQVLSAALIGICSHMSSKAILLLEGVVEAIVLKWMEIRGRAD